MHVIFSTIGVHVLDLQMTIFPLALHTYFWSHLSFMTYFDFTTQ